MIKKRKIVFLTGTRADFGKLKPLMDKVEKSDIFDCHIFVTGMHTLKKYGNTSQEVIKCKYKNIEIFDNQKNSKKQDIILANTIFGFSDYVTKLHPDMVIVHGDRVEALGGAIVGSLNNILVSHIEGGEISGTIDELIRHAVSKLSHIHFVANSDAKVMPKSIKNDANIFPKSSKMMPRRASGGFWERHERATCNVQRPSRLLWPKALIRFLAFWRWLGDLLEPF